MNTITSARQPIWFAFLCLLSFLVSCKKDKEDAQPAPTITSISPTTGAHSTSVTITGTNFSTTMAGNTVKFNGVTATITAATATQLTVTVPAKAGDGPVTVTVGSNMATSPAFDYLETVTVSTLAGSGAYGFADGAGSTAQFRYPAGVDVDATGNLYVTDWNNHRIRKITPAGIVSTIAGGTQGYADGIGSAAQFNHPANIATDAVGNLYVTDRYNYRIRKITSAGTVSTLAGSTLGYVDDSGTSAKFNQPNDVAVDAVGNLYVADLSNHCIRKITSAGVVSTLAGSTEGFADGTGSNAKLSSPFGITVDAAGNVYVADRSNHRIRKITPAGVVTTLAGSTEGYADGSGSAAQFRNPAGIALDVAGNLYVTDGYNHRIRKITPAGVVTTLAGSTEGYADGSGSNAKFSSPFGITVDVAGNLYVADESNNRIRRVVIE